MTNISVVSNVLVDPSIAIDRVTGILGESGFVEALDAITAWAGYSATPVVNCHDLAVELSLASVWVKDESQRLGLKSFKSLGGAYAVHRAYERWQAAAGDTGRARGPFTVTCVTDGNHGLSVAWGARQLGCSCVIYVPDVVTDFRVEAIRALGAEVVRIAGNYDEVTVVNSIDAAEHGWTIITDTSSDQLHNAAVTDVMQGYRVMAQELVEHFESGMPTHLFLQAGCGGMAASIVAHLASRISSAELPKFVIVEPERAACLQASASARGLQTVEGKLETMMAGLSVGEVSLPAWEILKGTVNFFVSMPDDDIPKAMKMLARADRARPAVISGETGAAGLAGLLGIVSDEKLRGLLSLSSDSRVLLINTEGDTDPALYSKLTA